MSWALLCWLGSVRLIRYQDFAEGGHSFDSAFVHHGKFIPCGEVNVLLLTFPSSTFSTVCTAPLKGSKR